MDPIDVSQSTQRIAHERHYRRMAAEGLLHFGVPFLDRALGGIRKNDLVLIGARSGAGKTELLASIAKANVEAGKRVHVFCLEAEEREFERRILYKLVASQFFQDKDRPQIPMSYREWLMCEIDDFMEKYEMDAMRTFEEKYQGLHTIYRRAEFGIPQFEEALSAIKNKTDLVLIDHLNYFDYDERQAENQAVTAIVKKIRDLALITGIPIVLVAHIRKRDRVTKAILPDLEDFMGSSNVYKIATQAILLAPAPKSMMLSSTTAPTYFRVGKFRVDGSITRYVARCIFNIERNEYERNYQLGHWRDGLEEFQPIEVRGELPRWAKEPRENAKKS